MPRKKLGKKIDVNGNLEDLGNTLSDEDLEKLDSLSKVATSGSYNDLSNKPSIPSIEGLATDQSVDEKLELLQLEFEQGIEGLIGELENSINDKANSSDLNNYLPLTAGSSKPLTDVLYADSGVRIGSNNYLNFVSEARFITPTKVIRFGSSTAVNSDLLVMTQSYLRPNGNNTLLGNSSNQWKEIYGTTIYQNGKQVANAEDIPEIPVTSVNGQTGEVVIDIPDVSNFVVVEVFETEEEALEASLANPNKLCLY